LVNDRLRAKKAKDQLDTWAVEAVKTPRTRWHQELKVFVTVKKLPSIEKITD
jgi:hypothetical protein